MKRIMKMDIEYNCWRSVVGTGAWLRHVSTD